MTWIELKSLRLWYEAGGPGPPLVLLHGLGSCGADWVLQMSAFATRYRVIAPDLRGHGRTSLPDGLLSIKRMAADVAELLDRLGARPAHVLGLSLGGCVALSLALDWPDCVRSLVLVNTGAAIRLAGRRFLRGLCRVVALQLRGPQAMAQIVAQGLFPDPEQALLRQATYARLSQVSPRAYRATILALWRFNVHRRLSEIRHSTLVIVGARDGTIGPELPRILAAGISGARLVVIPRSRHATPIDQPAALNGVVLDFLAEVEGRA